MMNLNKKVEVEKILDRVLKLLDDQIIQGAVDLPIREATASFEFHKVEHITYERFIKETGKFIQHIYLNGLDPKQKLTQKQAEAEAIAVLELGYQNAYGKGFYAAYLDSQNQNFDSLEFILNQISEIIVQRTKDRYVHWVITTQIEPLDWHSRCRIVKTFQRLQLSILPQTLKNCPPAMLADHLPDLINVLITADNTITDLTATDIAIDTF